MSTENQVEKEKKEDEKNIKPNTEEKKIENNNLKLEERKNPLENDKKEELEKKIQRAQRFGLSEKEEIGKKMISTEEELNKRKERFKDQLEEIEGEEKEKEKAKGERGRIIRNKFKKNNNYKNSYNGHRKRYRKSGGFHDRRIRGDRRRNNSYRK